MRRVGIILLDGSEVIIRIYEIETNGNKQLLHEESRDLDNFRDDLSVQSSEYIEIIAEISFMGSSMRVTDWKICSRNVSLSTIKDVGLATNMSIENLILKREQELICKGLLYELL